MDKNPFITTLFRPIGNDQFLSIMLYFPCVVLTNLILPTNIQPCTYHVVLMTSYAMSCAAMLLLQFG